MPSAGRVVDSGTITAGAAAGIFTDATQVWIANAHINQYVYLPRVGELALIVSNTATTLNTGSAVVATVGEAYHIRTNAVTDTGIPTIGTLNILNAAGITIPVTVALS